MLSDAQIRKAKSGEKQFKLSDSGGLYLLVTPSGAKLWRLKYRFADKEKVLAFGAYPEIGLAEARTQRDDAKSILSTGRDPAVVRKLRRLTGIETAGHTFEKIAREWWELNKPIWTDRHAGNVIDSLDKDVFPTLGNVPIADITPQDVLTTLRPIEQRGAKETARRLRQRMSATFVFGISTGRCNTDPAATVQKAMAPLRKGRQPAITDLSAAREMLRRAEEENCHPVTKLALRLLALTAVRPGTLITTPWEEWNGIGNHRVWTVPARRMKLKLHHKDDEARDHLVPMSTQAMDAIAALKTISGRGPLAFPNTRHAHRPMSENAIGYLLNRAGYHHKHVPHGWRATFSSVMNEHFPADKPVIDLMLAHVPKDKVEGAYNRALHMARRVELAQLWADLLLDGLKTADELVEGPRR